MLKLLKLCNDNHWYLIAAAIAGVGLVWLYGCQSTVPSITDPSRKITRAELQLEGDYLIGQMRVKMEDLDNQDAIKQLLIDQAAIFGQTGTFNPAGLLNTGVAIGAIAFGLDRNRKYKIAAAAAEPPPAQPPA